MIWEYFGMIIWYFHQPFDDLMGISYDLPSSNRTWLAGKSPLDEAWTLGNLSATGGENDDLWRYATEIENFSLW